MKKKKWGACENTLSGDVGTVIEVAVMMMMMMKRISVGGRQVV